VNRVINPQSLVAPVGYAHAVEAAANARTVYLAGQVAFDRDGKFVAVGDIVGQFDQALQNLQAVMHEAGGEMTDIVKLLIFVKDKNRYQQNLKEIGKVYREFFGKYYPAMTLVEVSSLFEDDALLEIEGIAVIANT
jgi:enamine deaminase RidA (YjgF/YER057c/UK114 family)